MLRYAAIIIVALALLGLVVLTRVLMRHHAPRPRPRRCAPVAEPSGSAQSSDNGQPARAAFLKHFALFAPIIGQVAARRMSRRDWTAAVEATGNAELRGYLRRYGTDTRLWARLLRMWGIEPESSAAIWGRDPQGAMYVDRHGKPLAADRRYRIASPAWTLTAHPGPEAVVTILCRGRAAEIGS